MRGAVCVLAAALAASCGHASKLDHDVHPLDALWDLAPAGTDLAVVATPRGVQAVLDGLATVRALDSDSELSPLAQQASGFATRLFGSPTAGPEASGFGAGELAVFRTKSGTIVVLPVVDRDTFLKANGGTRGSAGEDTVGSFSCREIARRYICTGTPALFDQLGTGKLRAAHAVPDRRGDIELYARDVRLGGADPGVLALGVQAANGTVSIDGRWSGTPVGLLGSFVGVHAPAPTTAGLAGFASFDAVLLRDLLPSMPLAAGVTTDDLTASFAGPVNVALPAGPADVQVRIPLRDAGPATRVIAACTELGTHVPLAATQAPGACRIRVDVTTTIELDAWVEGNELRLGSHRGASPAGAPDLVTDMGRQLASGDWAFRLWGRGTMLNLPGTPLEGELAPAAALGIRAVALIDELGVALRSEPTGVHFRVDVRTAWANPAAATARAIGVTAKTLLAGGGAPIASELATTFPDAPIAGDVAAGQSGSLLPAAAGTAIGWLIPAMVAAFAGPPPPNP